MTKNVAFALVPLLFVLSLNAQQRTIRILPQRAAVLLEGIQPVGGEVVVDAEGGTVNETANASATEAAEAASTATAPDPEQILMQKLQQTEIDRRNSTILELMGGRPEPEKPELTEAQKKAQESMTEAQKEQQRLQKEADAKVAELQDDITLGNWGEVGTFLEGLKEENAKPAYMKILSGLQATPKPKDAKNFPGMPSVPRPPNAKFYEKNVVLPEDVIGLADAAPGELEKDALIILGQLLRVSISQGNYIDEFMSRLTEGTEKLGGGNLDKRYAAALLLISANLPEEAGNFLPSVEKADKENDFRVLNLLTQYNLSLFEQLGEKEHLVKSWEAVQAILDNRKAPQDEKEEALMRALALAPKVDEVLGDSWMLESFTVRPERGMKILGTIGSIIAGSQHDRNVQARWSRLELQNRAVETLLHYVEEDLDRWKETLNLLALNFLQEAKNSQANDQSDERFRRRYDRYGNMYFEEYSTGSSGNQVPPISTGLILKVLPSEKWVSMLDENLRPNFNILYAQLHLKVNEEEEAFPYIAKVAETHPEEAKGLAEEFMRVWTNEHDPNAQTNRTNMYNYIYGYNPRAAAIPLTRSKQERNMQDLSKWITKIRELPIEPIDQSLLAQAFMRTHSQAEVYELEDLEKVFGELGNMEPGTIAMIVLTMQRNLASVWRAAQVQKDNNTNRTDEQMQREVLRGYRVAKEVLSAGLEKYPDNWRMQLAKAVLNFDEHDYRQEIEVASDFASNRKEAFGEFTNAAALYKAALPQMTEAEETAEVFERWFFTALGATDLSQLTFEDQAAPEQFREIRNAIRSLPGEATERHMAMFANALVSRMQAVQPELKHRYLKASLSIVGDHEMAADARELFEFYDDLVTEIEFVAEIDGSSAVGNEEPFGVYLDIHHTREIEREAGGFQKYLQNQNTGGYYYFNYGRPPNNYRDLFEESARATLDEHFEVISVTFYDDKIKSRGHPDKYGWRVTPYAYVLLKPRGPEVDKVPSLQLDLDFMDTTGYVVLPVETAPKVISADVEFGNRPMENLSVTQTLDERKAAEGKLFLEIKATANGLVNAYEDLFEIGDGDFEVVEVEDRGVAVIELDQERDENAVVSERNWTVEMRPKAGLGAAATDFNFATPKSVVEVKEIVYQRYDDADLVAVEPNVNLLETYGEEGGNWLWWVVGALVLAGIGGFFILRPKGPEDEKEAARYGMPEEITPFSVLNLLRSIKRENHLKPEDNRELETNIEVVEQYYFNRGNGEAPNLKGIAENWVSKVA